MSIAGTVFEEPWDSSAWENLLDLASHGDDGRSNKTETIEEEDDYDDESSEKTLASDIGDGTLSPHSHRTLQSDRVTQKAWDTQR